MSSDKKKIEMKRLLEQDNSALNALKRKAPELRSTTKKNPEKK